MKWRSWTFVNRRSPIVASRRIPGHCRSRDWFLYFRCPRCTSIAKHAPCAHRGFNTYMLCPACHGCYLAHGGIGAGAVIGVVAAIPCAIIAAGLQAGILGGIVNDLWPFAIVAPLMAVFVLFAKRYLSRYVLRYEYVGRSAT